MMHSEQNQTCLDLWLLKIAYGTMFLVLGVDKFIHKLAPDWSAYIHPGVLAGIPFDTMYVMWIIGILQIITGLLILGVHTRIGTYLAMIFFVLGAINIYGLGAPYILALYDIVLAVGALVLGRLAYCGASKRN